MRSKGYLRGYKRPVNVNRFFCGLYISKIKRPDLRSSLVTVFFQSWDQTSKHYYCDGCLGLGKVPVISTFCNHLLIYVTYSRYFRYTMSRFNSCYVLCSYMFVHTLFYSSNHHYAYPLLGVASYRTPHWEYSKCFEFRRVLNTLRQVFNSSISRLRLLRGYSWRRAETMRRTSEATAVSAKQTKWLLARPSLRTGLHTLVTRSHHPVCQPTVVAWQPHRH